MAQARVLLLQPLDLTRRETCTRLFLLVPREPLHAQEEEMLWVPAQGLGPPPPRSLRPHLSSIEPCSDLPS